MEAKRLTEKTGRKDLIYLMMDIGAERKGGDLILKANNNLKIIGLSNKDGVNINRYHKLLYCLSPIDAIVLVTDEQKVWQFLENGDVHITSGCGFIRIEILNDNKNNEIVYIFS